MKKKIKQNKYLDNKIGLIQAYITGHSIGICAVANEYHKKGKDYFYNYDAGKRIREMIEKDVRDIFKQAYKLGFKDAEQYFSDIEIGTGHSDIKKPYKS